MRAFSLRGRRRRRQAFTLVEVVLALGIVAFAVIPAVVLLPVGLNVHRSAINLTVGSQIVQRVTADLEQANFASLCPVPGTASAPSVTTLMRYFDDQGGELLTATGQPDVNSFNRIYDVKVIVTSPGSLPGLPGAPPSPAGAPSGPPSYNMLSVQILVANNPGHVPDAQIFTSASKPYSTYFALVAHRS